MPDIPLQHGDIARRCPVRAQLDHTPEVADQRLPPSDSLRDQMAARRTLHHETVEAMTAAGLTVADLSDQNRDPRATLAALARPDVEVISDGRLPDDPAGHRTGGVDLLVRSPGPDGTAAWSPVVVRRHMLSNPGDPSRGEPRSDLAAPGPHRATPQMGLRFRRNPLDRDTRDLAHQWRMLEAAGIVTPDVTPWGGIVDRNRDLWWVDLSTPVWHTMWSDRAVSSLERYDRAFANRLEVIGRAIRRRTDPSLERLVSPVRVSECSRCPWDAVCTREMEAADHVSLLPHTAFRMVAEHRERGVRTRADVARLNWLTAAALATANESDPRFDLPDLCRQVDVLPASQPLVSLVDTPRSSTWALANRPHPIDGATGRDRDLQAHFGQAAVDLTRGPDTDARPDRGSRPDPAHGTDPSSDPGSSRDPDPDPGSGRGPTPGTDARPDIATSPDTDTGLEAATKPEAATGHRSMAEDGTGDVAEEVTGDVTEDVTGDGAGGLPPHPSPERAPARLGPPLPPVLSLLARHGITEVGDLHHLDPLTLTYADIATHDLPRAIDQARAAVSGRPFRARDLPFIDVPRANVEVDVDMENVDDGVYLWGTLTVLRGAAAGRAGELSIEEGYRPFLSWEPMSPVAAGQVFVEFWGWLTELRRRCSDLGLTLAAYCYTRAEEEKMRQIQAEAPDMAGMPSEREISELTGSDQWVDLFRIARASLITGHGMGLKKLAPLAGFAWRDEDPGGVQSMHWHRVATTDPDPLVRARHRARVLAYNEDDVQATLALREWLDSDDLPAIESWTHST